jgi:4-alpha-glucanotransferase
LPCGQELGELGPDAFRFVEFLAAAGMSVWQVLPLGPTQGDLSPYMSPSVHAGNPRMISMDRLCDWGWLAQESLSGPNSQQERRALLRKAKKGFERAASAEEREAYKTFLLDHRFWLEDFSLYEALRELHHGQSWVDWAVQFRDRDAEAMQEIKVAMADVIQQIDFEQFVFFRQWQDIKHYANERGIELFGDMPIFVAHDSAEVWAHREYFDLDSTGQPRTVAGVPPDYFSETGQLWGNPHYRWDRMAQDGYQWWLQRMKTALTLFDFVRIDHFRGFEAYWEIPAEAETAMEGQWVSGPGKPFFEALLSAIPQLPVVAEDLGVITPEVEALREQFAIPGMKILQFAFDSNARNPYLPHNMALNCLAYTGTHDNNTTEGWFAQLEEPLQRHVRDYVHAQDESPISWELMREVLASPARMAIVPMQDILGLGEEARMNTPGKAEGNWRWRFYWDQLPLDMAHQLNHLVRLYGRGK